ncbi:hypothetical protein O3M35_006135 [Rhynocoris fuscipes]|uniref:G-protein coupled receptors family 1 profile domain-containing protein n=1 Tax=Rhynocoris fuscipes TaxID=488301 RepID=A0AAW1DC84_9HEMI
MTVLSITLVASLTVYSAVVLPKGGYYFNVSGLAACDPFYTRPSIRILAACSFYFPTTMLLMYCYGSAFHANKLRIKGTVSNSNDVAANSTVHKVCLSLSLFLYFSIYIHTYKSLFLFIFYCYITTITNYIANYYRIIYNKTIPTLILFNSLLYQYLTTLYRVKLCFITRLCVSLKHKGSVEDLI